MGVFIFWLNCLLLGQSFVCENEIKKVSYMIGLWTQKSGSRIVVQV